MADLERALIAKVLETGDLKSAVNRGVTTDHFQDDRAARQWDWILESWSKYGEPPVEASFKRHFPERLEQTDEPLDLLVDEVVKTHAALETNALIIEASQAMAEEDGDPEQALRILESGLSEIRSGVSVSQDIDLVQTTEDRMEHYRWLREHKGELQGIPTSFETIDDATGGLQEEQLVTIVGQVKQGKSWIALSVARAASVAGKRVLFVSFEMSAPEQQARYDALAAGVNAERLKRGQVSERELRKVQRKIEEENESSGAFILSTDTTSTTTVSGLRAKIDTHAPDLVVVDGAYFMDDENGEPKGTPRALTNITRSLKRLAQAKKIPVVITTQALSWKVGKGGKLDANAVGYSSSFVQDSDVLLGVEKQAEDEGMFILRIVLSRNTGPRATRLFMDWDTSQFEELGEVIEFND